MIVLKKRSRLYIGLFIICWFNLGSLQDRMMIANFEIQTNKIDYINYKSDFFSMYFNDTEYFGNELYNLYLTLKISHNNNIENFSIELVLKNIYEADIFFSYIKSFVYYEETFSLYKNGEKVGIVLFFIGRNYQDNQEVKIAEFNNQSLVGNYNVKSDYFVISDKKYHYNLVIVDYINYTEYIYSSVNQMLIFWNIGNNYDITLHNLLDITKFYGHISLMSTSYNIGAIGLLDPILSLIVFGFLFVFAFLSIFFIVRKTLKKKN